MLRPLRPDDVRELWKALSDEFGTSVIPKAHSPLMHAAGLGLALLRIQSKPEFMAHYTTVVHRRIYVPFAPGDARSETLLWHQASTGIHEHQHVVQAERDGFLRFATRYLSSSKWRSFYEAEAYGGDIELLTWAGQPRRSARTIAQGLAQYGITGPPVEAAFETLRAYEESAASGQVRNAATRWAIAWLEARLSAPDESVEPSA